MVFRKGFSKVVKGMVSHISNRVTRINLMSYINVRLFKYKQLYLQKSL